MDTAPIYAASDVERLKLQDAYGYATYRGKRREGRVQVTRINFLPPSMENQEALKQFLMLPQSSAISRRLSRDQFGRSSVRVSARRHGSGLEAFVAAMTAASEPTDGAGAVGQQREEKPLIGQQPTHQVLVEAQMNGPPPVAQEELPDLAEEDYEEAEPEDAILEAVMAAACSNQTFTPPTPPPPLHKTPTPSPPPQSRSSSSSTTSEPKKLPAQQTEATVQPSEPQPEQLQSLKEQPKPMAQLRQPTEIQPQHNEQKPQMIMQTQQTTQPSQVPALDLNVPTKPVMVQQFPQTTPKQPVPIPAENHHPHNVTQSQTPNSSFQSMSPPIQPINHATSHTQKKQSDSKNSNSMPPPKPLPKPAFISGRSVVMSPSTRHSYHEAMEAIAFIDDLGSSSSSGSVRSSTSTLRREEAEGKLCLKPGSTEDVRAALTAERSETLPAFPGTELSDTDTRPRQMSLSSLQSQQQTAQQSKAQVNSKPIYRSEKFLDLSAPQKMVQPPQPLPSRHSPCISRKAKSVLLQRAAIAAAAAAAGGGSSVAMPSIPPPPLFATGMAVDYRSEGEEDDRDDIRQKHGNPKPGYSTNDSNGVNSDRPATFSASTLNTYAYKKALTPYLFEPLLPEGNRILGIVVAIDIGSTCSGYAYSLHPDPENIRTMHLMEKGYTGVKSHKIPSALLLDARHNFHSFGYRAREFYYQLAKREMRDWLFFEGFKPRVGPNSKLSHSCMVTAANGVSIPLLEVMRHCFAFFRERALSELRVLLPAGFQLRSRDIHWILPVPSHWPVGGLDLVRRAALETGFAEQRTRLISEAEAAAAFCSAELLIGGSGAGGGNGLWWSCQPQVVEWVRRNRQEATAGLRTSSANSSSNHLPAASHGGEEEGKCDNENGSSEGSDQGVLELIVDCGGATTNLAVQRWDRKGEYRFIAQRGMSSGSTEVDDAFVKLLNDIFGSEFVIAFRSQCPLGYLELMNAFESRKQICSLSRDSAAFLNIPLPFSFISFHKEFKSYGVDQAIRDFSDPEILWTSQGMLKISRERMAQLFCPTVNRILRQIGELLEVHTGIQVLLLVGGFSKSEILRHELVLAFENKLRILIPHNPDTAILKGAVIRGWHPLNVLSHKTKYTYGLSVLRRHDPEIHPIEKRITRNGRDWCLDVFDPLVLANQELGEETQVRRQFTASGGPQQDHLTVTVFRTTSTDGCAVRFTTDPGVTACGTVRFDLTANDNRSEATSKTPSGDAGHRRLIEATFIFSGEGLHVLAQDAETKRPISVDCRVTVEIDIEESPLI